MGAPLAREGPDGFPEAEMTKLLEAQKWTREGGRAWQAEGPEKARRSWRCLRTSGPRGGAPVDSLCALLRKAHGLPSELTEVTKGSKELSVKMWNRGNITVGWASFVGRLLLTPQWFHTVTADHSSHTGKLDKTLTASLDHHVLICLNEQNCFAYSKNAVNDR